MRRALTSSLPVGPFLYQRVGKQEVNMRWFRAARRGVVRLSIGDEAMRVAGRLFLIATVMFSVPAMATDSWLIAQQGTKPDRVAVTIDAATIRSKIDVAGWMQTATPAQVHQAQAYAKTLRKKRKPGEPLPVYVGPDLVFEAEAELSYERPLKPDVAGTWYQINCTRQTIAVTSARVLWRHKAMENEGGTLPHPIGTPIERQIAAFVCGTATGAWPNGPPAALGFKHLGDIGIQSSNYVWPNLWADAKRPGFTYRPTQRDADAAVARFDANVAASKATVARAQEQLAESDKLIDRSSRVAKHRGRLLPIMESWIGDDEAKFVAGFGVPVRFVQARPDGTRVLAATLGYVSNLTHQSGAVLSSEDHTCDFTIFVKQGKVYDYEYQGPGCRDYRYGK